MSGVASIIRNYYDRDPLTFNTDWSGTMPMWGLTMWAKRGVPGAIEYVQAWFDAHVRRDPSLSDEEFCKTYTGHKSRVIRGRHLPFTIGDAERDRWMHHMRAAVAAMDPPPDVAAALLSYFTSAADAMRNTGLSITVPGRTGGAVS